MGDGLMATPSSIKLFLLVYLQGPNTNPFTFHYFFIRITAGRRRFCIIRKEGASISSQLRCSWVRWCRGGWRRAWRRRCGWRSSAGSPPASPSPATSRARSEAAISPSRPLSTSPPTKNRRLCVALHKQSSSIEARV